VKILMISFLEGKLAEKHPTYFVIEVGGIGFFLQIPLSSYDSAQEVGASLKILTHLHVREDIMALYGFMTDSERDLFKMLILVSGIGPPMALKILSGTSIADFKRLISGGDVGGLTQIKGIGQKIAQRLVLELKDRINTIPSREIKGVLETGKINRLDEASAALIGMGANPLQARKVITQVLQNDVNSLPIEEIIKLALKRI